MSKYKVGDRVKVRSDIVKFKGLTGNAATLFGKKFAGKTVKITKVYDGYFADRYYIKGSSAGWTNEMFESSKKFKDGDKVIIKNDLIVGHYGNLYCSSPMTMLGGTVATIKYSGSDNRFFLEGIPWVWCEELLDAYVETPEIKKESVKSNIIKLVYCKFEDGKKNYLFSTIKDLKKGEKVYGNTKSILTVVEDSFEIDENNAKVMLAEINPKLKEFAKIWGYVKESKDVTCDYFNKGFVKFSDVKIGDKLKVKSDLVVDNKYGVAIFVSDMKRMLGKIVTIDSKDSDSFRIKEMGCYWTPKMLTTLDGKEIVF